MTRQNLPDTSLGKAYLESLREEFPLEFKGEPPTLRQQLKDLDHIIAVEEKFLGNCDHSFYVYQREEDTEDLLGVATDEDTSTTSM